MIRISIDLVSTVSGRRFTTTSYCYIHRTGPFSSSKYIYLYNYRYWFFDIKREPGKFCFEGTVSFPASEKQDPWFILLHILSKIYDYKIN